MSARSEHGRSSREVYGHANTYSSMDISGQARVHLGNNYELADDPRQRMLDSLYYPSFNDRRDGIKEAAPRTFRWIYGKSKAIPNDDRGSDASSGFEVSDDCDELSEPDENEPSWPDFASWLRLRKSTYWISGKAGSGKSTLMAYIVEQKRTRRELICWSDNHSLQVLSFFFWRPGALPQHSISGLIRSLLYQICQQLPEDEFRSFHEYAKTKSLGPNWSERDLRRAIIAAIRKAKDTYFCIFIDGLDEFIGEYDELINLVDKFQALDSVKCCVSSRPEILLTHRLQSCENFRVQDFNRRDIAKYVSLKLQRPNNSELYKLEVVDNIVLRAEGVFLWAVLVTRSLNKGIACGDSMNMLTERLFAMPKELELLFSQMLHCVEDLHRASLVFYLQSVTLQHDGSFFPCISDLTAARHPRCTDIAQFAENCRQTENQILGHSAGLLEILNLEDQQGGVRAYRPQGPTKNESGKHVSNSQELIVNAPDSGHHYRFEQSAGLWRYERSVARWIHRSAFDFLYNAAKARDLKEEVRNGLDAAFDKMCEGRIAYMTLATSAGLKTPNTSWTEARVKDILVHITCGYDADPPASFHLLDQLRSALGSISDHEVAGLTWEELRGRSSTCSSGSMVFWRLCVQESYWEYIISRIKVLQEDRAGAVLHSLVTSRALDMAERCRPRSRIISGHDNEFRDQDPAQELQNVADIVDQLLRTIVKHVIITTSQNQGRPPLPTALFYYARGSDTRLGFTSTSYRTRTHDTSIYDQKQPEALMIKELAKAYNVWTRLVNEKARPVTAAKHRKVPALFARLFTFFGVRLELPLKRDYPDKDSCMTFQTLPCVTSPRKRSYRKRPVATLRPIRILFFEPLDMKPPDHRIIRDCVAIDASAATTLSFWKCLKGSSTGLKLQCTAEESAKLKQFMIGDVIQAINPLNAEQKQFAKSCVQRYFSTLPTISKPERDQIQSAEPKTKQEEGIKARPIISGTASELDLSAGLDRLKLSDSALQHLVQPRDPPGS